MPYQGAEERIDRLEELVNSFVAESRRDQAEMREWRLQSQKQWGEIAQRLGTFVEDIVSPNIPNLARTSLGLGDQGAELFSAPRVRVWHPTDPSKVREFDFIYATRRGWIVVESKGSPKLSDVDHFRETLAEAGDYFPQFSSLTLRPIFASLYLPDHVVKYCTRHAIFALGMGPETMQLLNLHDLPLITPTA